MRSLKELIKYQCKLAIEFLYPELRDENIEVSATTNAEFGDYQFNSAMRFSKILHKSPREIANNIANYFQEKNYDSTDELKFAKITVAGPGFINFTLSNDLLAENIKTLVLKKKFTWETIEQLNEKLLLNKTKVIIDFSSPNIAKEMHVGHLRSTIIGDCLANVLEYANYEVLRINHLGDWGTQFGMLIAYLKSKNLLDAKINLSDLVEYYKKAKYLFDQDQDFKKNSQQEVVLLQQGYKDSLGIWKKICDISTNAYQQIYKLLDIKIIDRGESFYNSMLQEVVEDFKQKQLLVKSEGAECVYLDGFVGRDNNPLPLIIKKTDGGYNYATTDLAAIKYRVVQENASWLIYVTDNGQSLHFAMIFAAAKQVGYTLGKDIKFDHVPLGLVLRSDGKKFKTREGDTVRLQDLIDNAIEKAKKLLFEKNSELSLEELERLSVIIGVNAIKYADLSNNRNSDYVFDLDKMLQFTGNTAAFLTYAYVRINSIKSKCNQENLEKTFVNTTLEIIEVYERNLALKICKFNDILNSVIDELLPNRLTDYLYLLAEDFHKFFHACKVIDSEYQYSRLLLCEAVSNILKQGFDLLGLKVVERM